MSAGPRAACHLPGRAAGGCGRGSTGRGEQGPGRGEGMPPRPPVGVQAVAPGTCLGHLPRGSFPRPVGPVCPAPGGGQPGAPSPALAWQPSAPRWLYCRGQSGGGAGSTAGGLLAQCRGQPRGQRGLGGGWSVSSEHEDAWSDGEHPGTETPMRERGAAGPRHGRASGGDSRDGAGGTRQGGPCPARAFVHGRRSAVPAPPGAEVLQSN